MIDFKFMHKFNFPFCFRKLYLSLAFFIDFPLLRSNFLDKINMQKNIWY